MVVLGVFNPNPNLKDGVGKWIGSTSLTPVSIMTRFYARAILSDRPCTMTIAASGADGSYISGLKVRVRNPNPERNPNHISNPNRVEGEVS